MPWKECSVMDERLRFVAKLLDGEAMTDVCREFGISRKTGYKIFARYKDHGAEALCDRSRRPVRYANQLPAQIESLIVRLKREKPQFVVVASAANSAYERTRAWKCWKIVDCRRHLRRLSSRTAAQEAAVYAIRFSRPTPTPVRRPTPFSLRRAPTR